MNETRVQQYERFIRENDEQLHKALCILLCDEALGNAIFHSRFTINTLMNIWKEEHTKIMQAFADVNGMNIPYTGVNQAVVKGVSDKKYKEIKKDNARRDRQRKKELKQHSQ